MAAATPLSLVRMRARKRRNKLRDLWPDVVDNITSGVRAGLALPEALGAARGPRGPAELRPAFAGVRRGLSRRPGDSTTASTGSRTDSATRSPTDSSSHSASPARSAAATSASCCAPSRPSCEKTPARVPSSRPGRAGRSTPPGSRSRRRGSSSRCWLCKGSSLAAYSAPAGWVVLAFGAGLCVVAYRVMVWIGRLPEEERVLR